MKPILALLTLTTLAFAAPAKRVTHTEHEDGTGSAKEIDPEKRESTETFFNSQRKPIYKIVYKLDDRLQPQSGVYYNNAGKIFQKSTYTLDGADRMIQEVVYDGRDALVCTKNYIWGTRFGKPSLVKVQVYDKNGRLTRTQEGEKLRRSR
jgi:hypothetical protein